MANTTTIVLTNAPDHRADSGGALLDDSEQRLRVDLEYYGTVVSVTAS